MTKEQADQIKEVLKQAPCVCFCSMHGVNCNCVEPEDQCLRCKALAILEGNKGPTIADKPAFPPNPTPSAQAIQTLIEWKGSNPNREWGIMHSSRISSHVALTLREGGFTSGGLIPIELLKDPPDAKDFLLTEAEKAMVSLQEKIWGSVSN